MNELLGKYEMMPWLSLASAIIKRANDDEKNPLYEKDVKYFKKSNLGKSLYDNVSMFEKIFSNDESKFLN